MGCGRKGATPSCYEGRLGPGEVGGKRFRILRRRMARAVHADVRRSTPIARGERAQERHEPRSPRVARAAVGEQEQVGRTNRRARRREQRPGVFARGTGRTGDDHDVPRARAREPRSSRPACCGIADGCRGQAACVGVHGGAAFARPGRGAPSSAPERRCTTRAAIELPAISAPSKLVLHAHPDRWVAGRALEEAAVRVVPEARDHRVGQRDRALEPRADRAWPA